ncbi:MAG: putative porin [Leptospiraceae bacterium]|nr:putative porin [Leptospiraceae bacterium]MCK6380926.1 putative porin [Leptospiraceae bacterium]
MRFFSFLFILLFFQVKIFSQTTLALVAERNNGEHIFETGNKYDNLSGLKGGSRITYPRNFNSLGIQASQVYNRFLLSGKFITTGNFVNSGEARDEDFFLRANSPENGTKIATREWSLHDSAYVFSGTQNFADGKGISTVSEYKIEPNIRYYFGDASPDFWKPSDGFFISTGLRYSYFKYYIYDVIQFVATNPITYKPIGKGLSYANSVLEFPIGLGYKVSKDRLTLEFSFDIVYGVNKFKDFHYWRAMNFNGESGGFGFQYKGEIYYRLSDSILFRFSHTGHRLFQSGYFTTKGGNSFNDILSNYAGKYSYYLNTKEFFYDLSIMKKLSSSK